MSLAKGRFHGKQREHRRGLSEKIQKHPRRERKEWERTFESSGAPACLTAWLQAGLLHWSRVLREPPLSIVQTHARRHRLESVEFADSSCNLPYTVSSIGRACPDRSNTPVSQLLSAHHNRTFQEMHPSPQSRAHP